MSFFGWLRKRQPPTHPSQTPPKSGTPANTTGQRESAAVGGRPKTQWVDINTLQQEPGPIWHETLSEQQLARIRRIKETFAEVDNRTLDKWIDGFRREPNIEREMGLCELMAMAYSRYVESHTLTLEGKNEVFKVVILRSMASEEEVLGHLDLKILTKEDAIIVMRGR
jgi:hypothetical protein